MRCWVLFENRRKSWDDLVSVSSTKRGVFAPIYYRLVQEYLESGNVFLINLLGARSSHMPIGKSFKLRAARGVGRSSVSPLEARPSSTRRWFGIGLCIVDGPSVGDATSD